MANKKLNIDLVFGTDTKQAKNDIKELRKSLNTLQQEGAKIYSNGVNRTTDGLVQSANQVSGIFERSMDPSTGLLNLEKLDQGLRLSGKTFTQFGDELKALGPSGEEAFKKMSNAILSAEKPMKKTSTIVDNLWQSMKNVITWKIESSALDAFIGSFQKAFTYAKNLNKSLNDIRIVTGNSVEQMKEFAVAANESAKALSTTTNEYAKASLIYYQQGLSDKEVKERTDTTVKMANVTGESAQQVSEWMTAVWNNFDDGSKSLEYYSDVMTALGAATASSSKEIAQGLEKFAAVSDTVGLSYEYATAALTTVTSQTRQSADVVGTAFKTLFARIQDLELGDTLEDGTTLGTYSEALEKVGINIKDQSGELKDMDDILDEMGSKWNTLGKDQQVALAKSVAGVRQYTQLIALMDNWDFMQENLKTAENATGTLQEQTEIYEESWEAANKKVQASTEAIYQQLLDDEFFIKLTNGLSGFLDVVSEVIDSLGGLKGILPGVITLMLQLFGNKMIDTTKQFTQALRGPVDVTGLIGEAAQATKESNPTSFADRAAQSRRAAENNVTAYAAGAFDRKLTPEQEEIFHQQMDTQIQSAYSGLEETGKSIDNKLKGFNIDLTKNGDVIGEIERQMNEIESALGKNGKEVEKKIQEITQEVRNAQKEYDDALINGDENKIAAAQSKLTKAQDRMIPVEARQQLHSLKVEVENFEGQINKASDSTEKFKTRIKDAATPTLSQNFMSLAQGVSSLVFAFQSLGNLGNIWEDDDLTFWEKLGKTLSNVAMVLPGLIMGLKSLQAVNGKTMLGQIKSTATTALETLAKKANAKATRQQTINQSQLNEEGKEQTVVDGTNAAALKLENDELERQKLLQGTPGGGQVPGGTPVPGGSSGAASGGFGAALKGALPAIGQLLIVVAVIAAIAIAINKLFEYAKEQRDKKKNEYKEAQEANENIKKQYDEMTASYDKLKQTISDYKDAEKGLKTLAKDTQEYSDALHKANEQAMELIRTNASLAGKYRVNEEGLITFDEGALEEAQKIQAENLKTSRMASMQAQQKEKDAKIEYEKDQFTRKDLDSLNQYNTDVDKANGATGMAWGAGAGAIVGGAAALLLASNPVGWITALGIGAGALIGTLLGGSIGMLAPEEETTDNETKALNAIAERYQEIGEGALTEEEIKKVLKEEDILDPKLQQSLMENTDALRELVSGIAANNAATEAQNLLMAKELLQNNAEFNSIKDSEKILSDIGADWYAEISEEAESVYKDIFENASTKQIEELFGEYVKIAGLDSKYKSIDPTDVKYKDGKFRIKVVTQDNEEKEQIFTANEVSTIMTSNDVLKDNEAIKNIIEEAEYLSRKLNSDDASERVFAKYLLKGNLDTATKEEMAAFYDKNYEIINEYMFSVPESLRDRLLSKNSEYFNAERMMKIGDLGVKNKKNIDGFDPNTITTNDYNVLAGHYENMEDEQQKKAYLSILDMAKEGLSGLDRKKQEEAWEQISKINWTTDANAATQLANIIKNFKGNIDTSSLAWTQVSDALAESADVLVEEALPQIDKAINKFKKIKVGDTFSYEELKNNGLNEDLINKYFRKTTDDKNNVVYQFVGSALSLRFDLEDQRENITKTGTKQINKILDSELDLNLEKLMGNNFASFDTGGYTGVWGSSGKLAVLHEKELILNKQDTANLLQLFKDIEAFSLDEGESSALTEEYYKPLRSLVREIINAGAEGETDGSYSVEQLMPIIQVLESIGKIGGPIFGLKPEDETNNTARYKAVGPIYEAYEKVVSSLINAPYIDGSLRQIFAEKGYMADIQEKYNTDYPTTKQIQDYLNNHYTIDANATGEEIAIKSAPQFQYAKTANDREQLYLQQSKDINNSYLPRIYDDENGTINELEKEKYLSALQGLQEAYSTAALQKIDEEAGEGLDPDAVVEYTQYLKELGFTGEEMAEDMAKSIMKMNRGVETLTSNWDTWYDILQTATKENHKGTIFSQEYFQALTETKKALSDVLDISEDFIDSDFLKVESNLNLISKAAEGDAKAIDSLGKLLAKDIFEDSIAASLEAGLMPLDNFESNLTGWRKILDDFINNLPNIELNSMFTGADKVTADLMNMVEQAGMTVEQTNALFRSMGFIPHYEMTQINTQAMKERITIHGHRTYNNPYDYVETQDIEKETYPVNDTVNLPSVTFTDITGKGDKIVGAQSGVKIKKLNYVGGGALNNFSGLNKGGNKSKNDKKKKTADKDIERYYLVNKQKEDMEREKSQAADMAEVASGKAKIDLLEKQIELSGQLRENAEQAYQESLDYLARDKARLEGFGHAIEYDSYGNIKNYTEIMQKEMAAYNAGIESKSEQTVKNAEERWEKFTEALKQYEETANLVDENDFARWEAKVEEINKRLEKIDTAIEIELKFTESRTNTLDSLLELAGDGIDKFGDKASKIVSKYNVAVEELELYSKNVWDVFNVAGNEGLGQALKEAIEKGDGDALVNLVGENLAEFTDEQINKIIEFKDNIFESLKTLQDLQKELVEETFSDFLDEVNDKYQEQQDVLEQLTSTMEHYNNIVSILGKDSLGISNELIKNMNKARLEINKTSIATLKNEYEALAQMEKEQAALYEANPEAYEESYKEIVEQAREKQEELNKALTEGLQSTVDVFKSSLEMVAENFEKAMSSTYKTIDEMQKAFDRQKTLGELYLQDYKKTYEISKLNRQITEDMAKMDNTKAKRELNRLAAEVTAFGREDVKMSQYDLGLMQKKYEVLKAQIALEESQNTKNQMTLQRDSEGNWGYVYTANQSEIEANEQSYEDSLYELQDYKYQSEMALQGQYLKHISDFRNAIKELAEQYGAESEEFQMKAQELGAYYSELTGFTLSELDKFVKAGNELYNEFSIETITTFDETLLGSMNSAYSSFAEMHDYTSEAIKNTVDSVIEEHQLFKITVDEVMAAAGKSTKDFAKEYEEASKGIVEDSRKIKQASDEMKKGVIDNFNEMMAQIKAWYDDYDKKIKDLTDLNTAYAGGLQTILNLYNDINTAANKHTGLKIPQGYDIPYHGGGDGAFNGSISIAPDKIQEWINTGDNSTWINSYLAGLDGDSGYSNTLSAVLGDPQTTYYFENGKVIDDARNEYSDLDLYNMMGSESKAKFEDFVKFTAKTEGDTITTSNVSAAAKKAAEDDSANSVTNFLTAIGATDQKTETLKPVASHSDAKFIPASSTDEDEDINKRIPIGSKFEILPRGGKEVTIYSQKNKKPIKYSGVENEVWTRSNNFVHTFEEEKYITAVKGTKIAGAASFYIPLYNINTYGNPGWLNKDNYAAAKYYVGEKNFKANGEIVLFKDSSLKSGKQGSITSGNTFSIIGVNRRDDNSFAYNVKVYDNGKYKNEGWIGETVISQLAKKFDTGGYTGEWGPEGRLALLHQKEIVLNAHDTENLLQTIDLVRSFNDRIESSARMAALGLSNIGGIASRRYGGDTLQQEVTIHAEFPNVKDHNEIELALNNLVNDASQYANRK